MFKLKRITLYIIMYNISLDRKYVLEIEHYYYTKFIK